MEPLHNVLRQKGLLETLPEVPYGLQDLLLLSDQMSLRRLHPLRHSLLSMGKHVRRESVLGCP